jgi:chemotaxis protein methyltransferase CheR
VNYTISDQEFQAFRTLVYQKAGIALAPAKRTLLVSRLSKRMHTLGLETFQAYYDCVTGEAGAEELTRCLDLISTNVTHFFREPVHFDFLREQVLPSLADQQRIRVWSAACSSGEEPYSIAVTCVESVANPAQWDCKILASDLSTRVLARAADAVYDHDLVSKLPPDIVRRHFLRGRGAESRTVKVKPHLREMVVFRQINLMDARYPIRTPLDVIFCRNVMIYFDRDTQEQLVAKFHQYLKPGGYLFTGHSESLQRLDHPFHYVAPTIYQKEG